MRQEKKADGGKKALGLLVTNMDAIRVYRVKRIGLFGSMVNGHARKDSDIDILVEFEDGHATYSNLMGLYQLLQRLFGDGRRIDLVTSGGLSPFIGPHILREVQYAEG